MTSTEETPPLREADVWDRIEKMHHDADALDLRARKAKQQAADLRREANMLMMQNGRRKLRRSCSSSVPRCIGQALRDSCTCGIAELNRGDR